jgi:hypothetical protein
MMARTEVSAMSAGYAAGASHHAAIAQALKASGAIVKLDAYDFQRILERTETPLVVTGKGGFLGRRYQYLTNYKGIFFFADSTEPLSLPSRTEVVSAKHIWIPG